MSIASDKLAVISLGSMCQTATQLRRHRAVIGDMLGLEMRESPQFFDWIAAPIAEVTRCIADIDLPSGPNELVERHGAYWPARLLGMTHYFIGQDGGTDISGTWQRNISMLRMLRRKWLGLEEIAERFFFVIANTQGNYSEAMPPEEFQSHYLFTRENVGALHEALESRFGSRLAGLLVVEADNTWSGDWSLHGVMRANLGPMIWHWEGDDVAWKRALLHQCAVQLEPLQNTGISLVPLPVSAPL